MSVSAILYLASLVSSDYKFLDVLKATVTFAETL